MLRKRLIISFFLFILVCGMCIPFSGAMAASTTDADGYNSQKIQCIYWFGIDITGCAASLAWSSVKAAVALLNLVAEAFNSTIDYTLNFKSFLQLNPNNVTNGDSPSIVDIGWVAFRDVTNILFIFVLLYIGISIIIGSAKYGSKSLLVKVLVGAVLINFSLFFTRALIDVSNVMTLQFYNAMTVNNPQLVQNAGTSGTTSGNTTVAGVSGSSATALAGSAVTSAAGAVADAVSHNQGISATILHALGIDHITDVGGTQSQSGGKDVTYVQFADANKFDAMKLLFYCVGSMILILVTAFVLGAAIVLLLIRAVTLVFLMILSPIAFAGKFLPGLEGYVSKWWKSLWSNLLFAPLYMANMYVVLKILTAQYPASGQSSATPVSFATIFSGGASAPQVAFTFFIIISLMIGCLVVAKEVGAAGAGSAMNIGKKWGKGASNYVGRTLPARAALATTRVGAGLVGGNMAQSNNAVTRAVGARLLQLKDASENKKVAGKSYNDTVSSKAASLKKRAELVEKSHHIDSGTDKEKADAKAAGRAASVAFIAQQAKGLGGIITTPTATGRAAVAKVRADQAKTKKPKSKTVKELEDELDGLEKAYDVKADSAVPDNADKRLKDTNDALAKAKKDLANLGSANSRLDQQTKQLLLNQMAQYTQERETVLKVINAKKKLEKAQKELAEEKLFEDDKK